MAEPLSSHGFVGEDPDASADVSERPETLIFQANRSFYPGTGLALYERQSRSASQQLRIAPNRSTGLRKRRTVWAFMDRNRSLPPPPPTSGWAWGAPARSSSRFR